MFDMHSFRTSRNISTGNAERLYLIIIVINTLFGIQLLNSFFSLLVNFLRERKTVSLLQVAIYAIVTFALVFFGGFLFKKLSKRSLFVVLVIAISIVRYIVQICRWAPLSLAASALGTILWILSLVFFISIAQQRKIKLFFTFFPAVLFGFAINTSINGLLGTWDMVWRPEPIVILILLGIIVLKIRLAMRVCYDLEYKKDYSDGSRAVFYSLIIVMPFVFLQLFQFQNIAALSAKTAIDTNTATAIITASNIAALAFAYLISLKKSRILITAIMAVLAVFSFWPEVTGWLYILQAVAGNIAVWWLLLIVLNRSVTYSKERVPWKNNTAFGISGLLLFIFAFVYYGSYDINLPIKSWMIPVFIAFLLAIFAILSASLKPIVKFRIFEKKDTYSGNGRRQWYQNSYGKGNGSGQGTYSRPDGSFGRGSYFGQNRYAGGRSIRDALFGPGIEKYALVFLMIFLFIVPAVVDLPTEYSSETFIQRDTVKVMHYNVHQGFNIDGYQDLESIARVIEKNGADIVSLNEVSRGWVVNGSADLYEWLSNRLGMQYKLFMPASDLVWGNAVLSRYPLKLAGSGFLPRMDAPLRRSYLVAEVDLSSIGLKNIYTVTTHLHHIAEQSDKRQAQVKALLDILKDKQRTVVFGDFNGQTGDPEITMMQEAGFIDTQLALGKQDELTWIHYKPYQRIDYIWVTPDIDFSNLFVTYSRASDHLPISVDIK
jgi:endonuclease/exonuclease/phosphatase family metal-dependent hydrolase